MTSLSGTKPYFFKSLRINFSAARLFRLGLDQHVEDLALGIHGAPEIDQATIDLQIEVSGAGEFRPRALSEPDVILSHHPAPIVRPLP